MKSKTKEVIELRLEEFQTYPFQNIDDYITDVNRATKFSFLFQGDEPDRSELTKQIYSEIFDWYDDKKHSGDTLITYRTAIFRNFYKKSYKYLPREQQERILNVTKFATEYDNDFPFEFEVETGGQRVKQICNNYQLGNFGIFPKGKINPTRAQSPYNDYFDLALAVIYDFYEGTLTPDDGFKKAILEEADYFNQFGDFETYVAKNYLSAFFDDEGYLIPLSEIENFDDYVLISNKIIRERTLDILNVLLENRGKETLDEFPEGNGDNGFFDVEFEFSGTSDKEFTDNKNEEQVVEQYPLEESFAQPYVSEKQLLLDYLKEVIDLERKKKIANYTLFKLMDEKKEWQEKMEYTPYKEHFSFELGTCIIIALFTFGISFAITMVFFILNVFFHWTGFVVDVILPLIFLLGMFVLPIAIPVYMKVIEYKDIQEDYKQKLLKKNIIDTEGTHAISLLDNNFEKLKNTYDYIDKQIEQLYSYGIIYKKYRTLEACTAIFEYLESGRCSELTGPHGAYNKFEAEVALGNVITELKSINISVRAVIENQIELQSVTRNIAENVNDMYNDIRELCSSTRDLQNKFDEIANNTKISAFSSTVLATQVKDWSRESYKLLNKI